MSQYRLKSKELQVSELQKQLQHVNLNAAGLDVGSDRHLVAAKQSRFDTTSRSCNVHVGEARFRWRAPFRRLDRPRVADYSLHAGSSRGCKRFGRARNRGRAIEYSEGEEL